MEQAAIPVGSAHISWPRAQSQGWKLLCRAREGAGSQHQASSSLRMQDAAQGGQNNPWAPPWLHRIFPAQGKLKVSKNTQFWGRTNWKE